jgi:hypothetical protein
MVAIPQGADANRESFFDQLAAAMRHADENARQQGSSAVPAAPYFAMPSALHKIRPKVRAKPGVFPVFFRPSAPRRIA